MRLTKSLAASPSRVKIAVPLPYGADFPRAIKRLWQLNLFQDVQIHFNEETEKGLSITIEIKENFVLGEINY